MDLVQAYVCRETGKVYCLMEESDMRLEEVPEDLATSERYIPLQAKRDFDLGSAFVVDSAVEVMPDQAEQVRADFRRSGAYSRFKDRLMHVGLTAHGYAFEQAATARHCVSGQR